MGTPDFAVGPLKALVESGHNIAAVITAADKPAGRGQKVVSPPVKIFAEKAGIQYILQPANLKSLDFIEELKTLHADLFVVVAFRMLPEVVWSMPPKGTINLHASLLPDYRGAAPINWAIMNGEKETGVTTFFIEKEIDTGKIIYRDKVNIYPDENAGSLHDRLMDAGAKLLIKTIESISLGENPSVHQMEMLVNGDLHAAPKIFKADCRIDWHKDGKTIHNFIRGLSPHPAAWTELAREAEVLTFKILEAGFEEYLHDFPTGAIITDLKKSLKIAVKDGYINIKNLQQAGRKSMNAANLLIGFQDIEKYKLLL